LNPIQPKAAAAAPSKPNSELPIHFFTTSLIPKMFQGISINWFQQARISRTASVMGLRLPSHKPPLFLHPNTELKMAKNTSFGPIGRIDI
jgi:hypothetical protein